MSYVVKAIRANKGETGDPKRLLAARASSTLDVSVIEQEVLAGLGDRVLGPLGKDLRQAVGKIVVGELRFLQGLGKPAGAITEFYEHEATRKEAFVRYLGKMLQEIAGSYPTRKNETGVLTIPVPLISLARNPEGLVDGLVTETIRRLFLRDKDGKAISKVELGGGLASSIFSKVCKYTGTTEEKAVENPNRLKWPKGSGLPAIELVKTFLGGTPLEKLLLSEVEVVITDKLRFEHSIIVAGAGHGKSQLLGHILSKDFSRPKGQEPGLMIIDSTGDFLKKVGRLKCFAGNDRLLIIDAADAEYPISLSPFDLGGEALDGLSLRDREEAAQAKIEVLEFVLGGLFDQDFTVKQAGILRYIIKLLLEIPDATLVTLLDVLDNPQSFLHVMESLPPIPKRFFLTQFMDKQFGETRKQISRRVYHVLTNDAFSRMFGATTNRLNVGKALSEGRTILVNASRNYLKDSCQIFGRYAIGMALQAAFDRSRIPEDERRTSFVVIDEASEYLDHNVAKLLEQVRKYRIGITLAMQGLDQMSDALRASVMSNTSIKMVGGSIAAKDGRYIAHDMLTSDQFIMQQYKDDNSSRFATFLRNVTPSAVTYKIPFGSLENMSQMTEAEWIAVRDRSRREVSCGLVIEEVKPKPTGKEPDNDNKKRDGDEDDFSEPWVRK